MIFSRKSHSRNHGFTLVELSIVLVILGLLVGGVLTGQSLIRAAELRSVSNDMFRYQTAVMTFRDKYFAIPGDMANATKYWGTDPNGCPTHAPAAALTQTCDGDGNGQIPPENGEPYRFWQQLAAAGLIEGSFTGVTGAANNGDADAGINVPKLKFGNNNGVSIIYHGNVSSTGSYLFPGSYGNAMIVGQCVTRECAVNAFVPADAYNIDMKLDDGKPGMGQLVSRVGSFSGNGPCNNAPDDSAASAASATYSLQETAMNCAFYYKGTF